MNVGSMAKGEIARTIKNSRSDKNSVGDGSNQTEGSTGSIGGLVAITSKNERGAITDSYRENRTINSFANDNTPASIRILSEKDNKDLIPTYTKFILESVQESHSERQQIVETFGDFYVFMYGERPPIYNFGGTLINSKNTNWVADFMLMYERYLRGTRCAEKKARILLTYGGRQIEGYIINTSNQTAASTQEGVSFSFQMIVTSRKLLGVSSDLVSDASKYKDPALSSIIEELSSPGAAGSSSSLASQAKTAASGALGGLANATGLI